MCPPDSAGPGIKIPFPGWPSSGDYPGMTYDPDLLIDMSQDSAAVRWAMLRMWLTLLALRLRAVPAALPAKGEPPS